MIGRFAWVSSLVSGPIEVAQPMSAISNPASRLAQPDSRPMVVTAVVVGYLLICSLGGLNALVVLANGSTRVVLVESPSQNPFENIRSESGQRGKARLQEASVRQGRPSDAQPASARGRA